jgi:hypothetical protein
MRLRRVVTEQEGIAASLGFEKMARLERQAHRYRVIVMVALMATNAAAAFLVLSEAPLDLLSRFTPHARPAVIFDYLPYFGAICGGWIGFTSSPFRRS